jgi:hypothetical protein
MQNYSWLEFHDDRRSDAVSRFSSQYYPAIIAYITAGKRRYAQFNGNVPNLYLINAAAKQNEIGVDPSFKEPHFHTYWLKRAILAYVDKRVLSPTTIDDVIEVFCGRRRGAYSENLVRYVMGSLTEVPTSELIEADIAADGDGGRTGYVRNLSLTTRGQFLLREFADTFVYLQIIIDDWRLLIPNDLLSDFDYQEPDYSYLVRDHYRKNVRQLLIHKGAQTCKFAILLEEVLSAERLAWPNVFKRLDTAGVTFPATGEITNRVRKDIEIIHDAIQAGSLAFLEDDRILASFRKRAREVVAKMYEPIFDYHRARFAKSPEN